MCGAKCKDQTALFIHLKYHIRDGTAIQCPYVGCKAKFKIFSFFTSHKSRKHMNPFATNISELFVGNNKDINVSIEDLLFVPEIVDTEDSQKEIVGNNVHFQAESFTRALALFYLQLQTKLFLSVSTIDKIAKEIQNINYMNISHILTSIADRMHIFGASADQIKETIALVHNNNLHNTCHGENGLLRSKHTRQIFFKANFPYIAPKIIKLGRNLLNKISYYSYVSVVDVLNKLLLDKSFLLQIENSSPSVKGVYSDFTDGRVFQKVRNV
ncbi:uncharacterized protein LOC136096214 [Hydra vulgaris]|uniref:uncharacterized protein LOC136096214 n=1 Tax=Hydra vulgaris TaxID=6087 RepID=UPI0032EA2C6F